MDTGFSAGSAEARAGTESERGARCRRRAQQRCGSLSGWSERAEATDAGMSGNACAAGKALHVHFGDEGDMERAGRSSNPSQEYIILQNNQLHSEIAKSRARVERLVRERDVASQEADSSERSRVRMRGVLHNAVEVACLRRELCWTREGDALRARSACRAAGAEILAALSAVAALDLLESGALGLDVGAWRAPVAVGRGALALLAGARALLLVAAPPALTDTREEEAAVERAERGSEHLHSIVDEL